MSLADDYEGSFSNLTNRSEYSRQSWRDSYNDGRAAGDFTGAVNARLDAERAAFQGATWGGSSTQPSALRLAQAIGMGRVVAGNVDAPTYGRDGRIVVPVGSGPGVGFVPPVAGAAVTSGPGMPVSVPKSAVARLRASKLRVDAPPVGADLVEAAENQRFLPIGDWSSLGLGKLTWEVAPNFIDMEDIEDIYGDDIGSWPFVAGKLFHDVAANFDRAVQAALDSIENQPPPVSWGRPYWAPGETPESDLPNPMNIRPMSAW